MLGALLSKWKNFFLRIFDIRVGEHRRVWLMLLHIFLLIQSLWIIKPVNNALFLSRVGIDNLPLVFLLVALTAFAVSNTYARWLSRMSLGRIMKRTHLISILVLLTFAFLLRFQLFQDWMSYVFYIGVALFGLVTTSQFWLLGNMLFSSLEAKRLFGFIGAGAIAGGIGGGYMTSVLAPVLDGGKLLFVASGLLIISLVVSQKIWVEFGRPFKNAGRVVQTQSLQVFPLRLIRNSKHLSFLALIMGISVVVAKLVEFQFSAIASGRIQDPDRLTAFFGFWFSTSNAVSLAIQLLMTQRVIAFLGVGRSLFVLPGALMAGAATVLYAPVIWAGTMLKLFDISLKQSINKAATELLIMPVPLAVKNQAKTFIDVFVDTTATGIGGLVLIFLINGLDLSVRAVSVMILALISVWVYFVIRVRKEYVLAFEEKLGIIPKSSSRKDIRTSDLSVIEGIRRTLHSGSTKQILFLLDRIEESKDQRLMPDAIPLLGHESPKVRQAALRCLYYFKDHTITRQIEPLLKDEDEEVRSRAFSCLLAHTRQDRVRFIEDYLADVDPAVSGAALVGLATEARDNPEMQRAFNLEQRLLEKINAAELPQEPMNAENNKILVTRAIGYGKLNVYYPLLRAYMEDENPVVARQAILAAGSSQDPGFIKLLLHFLSQKLTRSTARKALSRYEPEDVLPLLTAISREKGVSSDVLIQLPSLAEKMDTRQAVDYLFELARHPGPAVKIKALETLHKLQIEFPYLTISGKRIMPILMEEADLYRNTLAVSYATQYHWKRKREDPKISEARKELIGLLERKLDRILKRIFWLLGLHYPPGVILPLWKDIHHRDPNVRMNSVELLDNILDPILKTVVLPIMETALLDRMPDDVLIRLQVEMPTEASCFESLLKGEDDRLKHALLNLIEALDHPDYIYLIHLAARDEHPRVRNHAENLLAKE